MRERETKIRGSFYGLNCRSSNFLIVLGIISNLHSVLLKRKRKSFSSKYFSECFIAQLNLLRFVMSL